MELPKLIPFKIKLSKSIHGDWPIGHDTVAKEGEYYCFCNQYGAVSVTAQNGRKLGLKPGEFEVLEWTENAAYVLQNPTYAELLDYAAGQRCVERGQKVKPDCGYCVPCRARIAKGVNHV